MTWMINMDYNEVVEKYEQIKFATKTSIEIKDSQQQELLDATALAILYIQNEKELLTELAKRSNLNKNDAVYYHLQSHLPRFDQGQVRQKIRSELGFYDSEFIFRWFLLVAAVGFALVVAASKLNYI